MARTRTEEIQSTRGQPDNQSSSDAERVAVAMVRRLLVEDFAFSKAQASRLLLALGRELRDDALAGIVAGRVPLSQDVANQDRADAVLARGGDS